MWVACASDRSDPWLWDPAAGPRASPRGRQAWRALTRQSARWPGKKRRGAPRRMAEVARRDAFNRTSPGPGHANSGDGRRAVRSSISGFVQLCGRDASRLVGWRREDRAARSSTGCDETPPTVSWSRRALRQKRGNRIVARGQDVNASALSSPWNQCSSVAIERTGSPRASPRSLPRSSRRSRRVAHVAVLDEDHAVHEVGQSRCALGETALPKAVEEGLVGVEEEALAGGGLPVLVAVALSNPAA